MNKRKAYPTDMSDAQWLIIEPLIPAAKRGGRRRSVCMREIVNAIFYLLRSGCAWRLLPHDLPAWQTVYGYFRRWREAGIWEMMNDALRTAVRVAAGRLAQPAAAIIDSQSVKCGSVPGFRGYDRFKMVKGKKRHILVDVMGLLLMVVIHPANDQDRKGARYVLTRAAAKGFRRLQRIWADGSYLSNPLNEWLAGLTGWILEVVSKPQGSKGFVLLPRRWVVERTFAWLGNYRRLSKDYEQLHESSEAMIYIAMIHLMLQRLGRHSAVAV